MSDAKMVEDRDGTVGIGLLKGNIDPLGQILGTLDVASIDVRRRDDIGGRPPLPLRGATR